MEGRDKISIGFDAKRAFFNNSGLGNYSRNLLSALADYYPENTYTLFTPKTKNRYRIEHEEKFRVIAPAGLIFKLIHPLWRSKYLIKDFKNQHIQIYHGLSQELPVGIERSGVKSVVTVHDLIFMRFPEFYKWIDSGIYTRKLIHACRVADRIVAISNQTRDDLVNFLKVPQEKISVIYQGCNPCFWNEYDQEENQHVKAKYNLPERYLLYVGTIEERKNLLGILKAIHIAKIDIPLVVIGRKTDQYYRKVLDYIGSRKLENIIFPGSILNEELPLIYRNAECFIYPSFFEGFGIPLVEALVSGIPVITSKGSCFDETAGPGSIYIDPESPEEIGNAISRVINDKRLRVEMIAKGTEYARNFKNDAVSTAYIKQYNMLLK